MRSRWKQFRYWLEWAGLMIVAKVVPRLSRRVCSTLADFLGAAMSILDRRGRAVALANLEAALGDETSILQRKKIARESFQHFARTMLDLFWSPRLTKENFRDYIELENFEELVRAAGTERSVIVACFHYSNFEWLSHACAFSGLNGTIINQEFKNARLDSVFRGLREHSGHELIPRERGILRLYKALRRKGRTALLVDLTVPPERGAVVIECFGMKTSVTSAHAWLHQQTGVPIVPAHCQPLRNGRYRMVFHRKIDNRTASAREIAQACWDSFEPFVRQNPGPWLWMYKHWRYRPSDATRPYPFYANVSPGFERLLRAKDDVDQAQR